MRVSGNCQKQIRPESAFWKKKRVALQPPANLTPWTLKTVLDHRISGSRPPTLLHWSATTPKLKFTSIGWFE